MLAAAFHVWAATFALSLAAGMYSHPGWLVLTAGCIVVGAWHWFRE